MGRENFSSWTAHLSGAKQQQQHSGRRLMIATIVVLSSSFLAFVPCRIQFYLAFMKMYRFLSLDTFRMIFQWSGCPLPACWLTSLLPELHDWVDAGRTRGGGGSSQLNVQHPTPPNSQLHQNTCHPEQPSNAIRVPPPPPHPTRPPCKQRPLSVPVVIIQSSSNLFLLAACWEVT